MQVHGQQRRTIEERLRGPIVALFERGRSAGEFSRSLSPLWMADAFGAVCVVGVHEIALGHMDQAEAEAMMTATLLYGLLDH